MLRKSFSIKRSENSKERTFNPVECGTCFSPVSLCLRKHLNYRSCVRSHQWLLTVTGGTNIRTTESGSKNTTLRRCCTPSITACPCSDWQHSCQSLHTPQQPCRNANKQTASVSCPCPCSQRLWWLCMCSGTHLGPGELSRVFCLRFVVQQELFVSAQLPPNTAPAAHQGSASL